MTQIKLLYFIHLMRSKDSLEKKVKLGKVDHSRKRERLDMKWIGSTKEVTALSLQELSSAVNHGRSVIHVLQNCNKNGSMQSWKLGTPFPCAWVGR